MLTWIWWCPSSAQERPSSAALVWLFPLFPYWPEISNCFHSSMNVIDLRLLVEERSAKPEEHRLQEAHRLWPLGSSVAVRLLDGHLISHVLWCIKVVKTHVWWYSKWGTAGLCIPGWFIRQADYCKIITWKGISRFDSTHPSPINSNVKSAFDCSGEIFGITKWLWWR